MWYRVLVLSALCLWPALSHAAVIFDATSYAECASCSSLSLSHAVAAGSNLGLAAGVTNFEAAGCCDYVSTVTYNSVGLTNHCWNETSPTVPRKVVEWWYLAAPTTGANTLAVTAGGLLTDLSVGVTSASGVNQTTPMGTCANATGTSTTPSTTVTSVVGDLVLDAGVIDHVGTLTVDASQTQLWNDIDGSGNVKKFGSREDGAASVVMSWSNSTGSPYWILTGISLQQAGGGVVVPGMTLLGVGQ